MYNLDIKKFITSDKIDSNYNKLLKTEREALKMHGNEANISNKFQCLYALSDLDFIDPCVLSLCLEATAINKFKQNFIFDDNCVCFGGPMIKKNFVSSHELQCKKYFVVSVFGAKNLHDIINTEKLNDNTHEIQFDDVVFKINKTIYTSPTHAILSQSNVNQVGMISNNIYVSGTFLIELYKSATNFDEAYLDPIYAYPVDALEIYEPPIRNNNLKNIIDIIDIDAIRLLNSDEITSTFIQCDNNKLTALEYAMINATKISHPVLRGHAKQIALYLATLQFVRHPCFIYQLYLKHHKDIYDAIAKEIKKKKTTSSIYKLSETDIDYTNITNSHCIDMYILNYLIQKDNAVEFFEYATKVGITKKFQDDTKTGNKLIEWIITYNPTSIISHLVNNDMLSIKYKYNLLLLTQNIEMFDEKLLAIYKWKDMPDKPELSQTETELLLTNISDVIKCNAVSSFLFIVKLLPTVLTGGYTTNAMKEQDGNLLHTITTDSSVKIIELIVNINKQLMHERNKDGQIPLVKYAALGLNNSAESLLALGSPIDTADKKGNTFLHEICATGNTVLLGKVLNSCTNLMTTQNIDLETPILLACKNGHEDIYYSLNKHNNVDVPDQFGNTVYHYICLNKMCLGLMIPNKKNAFGFTPQDYCTIASKFYHFIDAS